MAEGALREVVRGLDFRRLLRVRLSGQFADGLFQAALFSAVFFNPERATSAGQAAAAFATLLLPYSVVGPFAGVLLDRWRRQRVLQHGNVLRAAVVVVFAVLLAAARADQPAGRRPGAGRRVGQPLRAVRAVGRAAAGGRRPAPGDRQLLHHHPRRGRRGSRRRLRRRAAPRLRRGRPGRQPDRARGRRRSTSWPRCWPPGSAPSGSARPPRRCTSGSATRWPPWRVASRRARSTCASAGPPPAGSRPSPPTASSTA